MQNEMDLDEWWNELNLEAKKRLYDFFTFDIGLSALKYTTSRMGDLLTKKEDVKE